MSSKTSLTDYANGSFIAAGSVAALSIGAGFYGVIRGTSTRPNFNILSIGTVTASTMLGIGTGFTAYQKYITADKEFDKLFNNAPEVYPGQRDNYTLIQKDAAISMMIASAAGPTSLIFILNPINPVLRTVSIIGGLTLVGSVIAMGIGTAAAVATLKSETST